MFTNIRFLVGNLWDFLRDQSREVFPRLLALSSLGEFCVLGWEVFCHCLPRIAVSSTDLLFGKLLVSNDDNVFSTVVFVFLKDIVGFLRDLLQLRKLGLKTLHRLNVSEWVFFLRYDW